MVFVVVGFHIDHDTIPPRYHVNFIYIHSSLISQYQYEHSSPCELSEKVFHLKM